MTRESEGRTRYGRAGARKGGEDHQGKEEGKDKEGKEGKEERRQRRKRRRKKKKTEKRLRATSHEEGRDAGEHHVE
eukprot:3718039-Rhodomonas_salina.1